MGKRKTISTMPLDAEVSAQQAADMLNVSGLKSLNCPNSKMVESKYYLSN
jgi:hypothetical protein